MTAPRPIRPLPGTPSTESEQGLRTGLAARTLIVASIVLGQLWALTVALESYLSGHEDYAWGLAAFSVLSFAVAAVVVWIEPPVRSRTRPGRR